MSIERKRNLLRISREKIRGSIFFPKAKDKEDIIEKDREKIPEQIKDFNLERINTSIKSEYLGSTLYPNYIGKYEGSTFIVAGCGSSLKYYNDFSKYYVIGVNDIERILTPDFLVVVNEYRTFMRGRWEYVSESLSPVIFTHMDNPGPITRNSNLVKIKTKSSFKITRIRLIDLLQLS